MKLIPPLAWSILCALTWATSSSSFAQDNAATRDDFEETVLASRFEITSDDQIKKKGEGNTLLLEEIDSRIFTNGGGTKEIETFIEKINNEHRKALLLKRLNLEDRMRMLTPQRETDDFALSETELILTGNDRVTDGLLQLRSKMAQTGESMRATIYKNAKINETAWAAAIEDGIANEEARRYHEALKAARVIKQHAPSVKALRELPSPEQLESQLSESIDTSSTAEELKARELKRLEEKSAQYKALLDKARAIDSEDLRAVTNAIADLPDSLKKRAAHVIGTEEERNARLSRIESLLTEEAIVGRKKAIIAKIDALEEQRKATEAAAEKAREDARQADETEARRLAEADAQLAHLEGEEAIRQQKLAEATTETERLKAQAELARAQATVLEQTRLNKERATQASSRAQVAAVREEQLRANAQKIQTHRDAVIAELKAENSALTRAQDFAKKHSGKILIGGFAFTAGTFAFLMAVNPRFRAAVQRQYKTVKKTLTHFTQGT